MKYNPDFCFVAEAHVAAGLLDEVPTTVNPELPEGSARPGQTGAHRVPTEDDPMREMKICFSGDQLTRVRFAGTTDLFANSDTPSDRIEHCGPYKGAMWHTKVQSGQFGFSRLYKEESVNEKGTLKFFQER